MSGEFQMNEVDNLGDRNQCRRDLPGSRHMHEGYPREKGSVDAVGSAGSGFSGMKTKPRMFVKRAALGNR